MQKVIQVGSAGQVVISEAAGVASVKLSLAESAGGGDLSGVVKASLSAEVEISAVELIDAGLELAKEKFPAAASLLDGVKAIIDAEIAQA